MRITDLSFYCKITVALLGVLLSSDLQAQTAYSSDIHYRINEYRLDADYKGNSTAINQIDSILSLFEIVHVDISSAASPDGPKDFNEKLAQKRLNHLVNLLLSTTTLSPDKIRNASSHIDWERLAELIDTSDLAQKDEILAILRAEEASAEGENDKRMQLLKRLNEGKAYKDLRTAIFPHLRYSAITIYYNQPDTIPTTTVTPELPLSPIAEEVKTDEAEVEAMPIVPLTSAAKPMRRNHYWNISTNMLYLATVVPNIAAEAYLGKGFTVKGGWTYTWLKNDKRNKYWRLYGGEVELRKWLGKANKKNPFGGHHIGVGVQMGTYDIELTDKGQLSHLTTAISLYYGYSLPIAKRLNIDFGAGAGYVTGNYKKYVADHGCYVYQSTHKRKYFGPTKLDISLVWLLGRGNANPKYIR